MIRGGKRPAKEYRSEEFVPRRSLIDCDNMSELMIHHPIEALIRRGGFKDILVRFNPKTQIVERHAPRTGLSVVVKIVQKNPNLLARRVLEEAPVEVQRIFKTTGEMGNDIRMGRVVVDKIQVLGPDVVILGAEARRTRAKDQADCRQRYAEEYTASIIELHQRD